MVGYLSVRQLQLAVGDSTSAHEAELKRAIEAATRLMDRWTGRRFLRDTVASSRLFRAVSCDRVCVGDFDVPAEVVVETDDAGDGTWVAWSSGEWQPEADDRGNGPFVRLDGEPWRWIGITGSRKFPVDGRRPRVRVTTKWGPGSMPGVAPQACQLLSSLFFRSKDMAGSQMGIDDARESVYVDPISLAKAMLMDYAVEGGTLYQRALVGS